jgi:uncharacterized OB-fold protein
MTDLSEVAVAPPVPAPSPMTAFFWEGVARHELMILRCESCGRYVHYPRPICDACQGTALKGEKVSGKATIYSYAIVMQAFHPHWVDLLPYFVAEVELVEQPGLRLTTNIVGCDESDLAVGVPVQVVFTEVSPGVTLPLFELVPEGDL